MVLKRRPTHHTAGLVAAGSMVLSAAQESFVTLVYLDEA